jgi:hypothetical protein
VLFLLSTYAKGTQISVSDDIKVSDTINIHLNKIFVKPTGSDKNYVIFYADVKRNSLNQITVLSGDPCLNMNYDEVEFQECTESEAYTNYTENEDNYNNYMETQGIILEDFILRSPGDFDCVLDQTYGPSESYPNISDLNYDWDSYLVADEASSYSIVFKCPETKGKFELKYKNEIFNFRI